MSSYILMMVICHGLLCQSEEVIAKYNTKAECAEAAKHQPHQSGDRNLVYYCRKE